MKFSAILFGAALYLFSSVEASIVTNTPFNAITWSGGAKEKVVWSDDGKAPKLPDLGTTSVDLMVGGDKNQVLAANIGSVLAIAKQIEYTVPKNVGPPGPFYFIKYTSEKGGTFFSGLFTIDKVNGNIAGFDPKNPNTPPAASNNATTTPNNAAVPNSATAPNNTTTPATGNPSTGSAYGTSGYGNSGYGNSSPTTNDATSSPSPNSVPTAPATSNANANTNALPNSISSSDASNSIPSFAGVATAAIAFAFTYLY